MNRHSKQTAVKLCMMAMVLIISNHPVGLAHGSYNCAEHTAEPPFMATSVDPNLLLLIDNSASMYDTAYIGEIGGCYDGPAIDNGAMVDSYNATTVYSGYFQTDDWYEYNNDEERFEASSDDPYTSSGYAIYRNSDVCVGFETPLLSTIVHFKARGNFLNWALASKFDIQKKILTGGKYDATNDLLIMESRGCSGRRFIKQITVYDGFGTDAAIPNYLALGIYPADDHALSADPADADTTLIDIFQINEYGFNHEACQAAIDEMADENSSLGTIKGLIDECLTSATSDNYASNGSPAYNQAVQTCWYADEHGWPDNGAQHVTSLKNYCADFYNGIDPAAIDPLLPAYVCQGNYDASVIPEVGDALDDGYIGRCWVPAVVDLQCDAIHCDPADALAEGDKCIDGVVWTCPGSYKIDKKTGIGTCNKNFVQKCFDGGTGESKPGYWRDDIDADICVDKALQDFCGALSVPQVVDPSDLQTSTGETWNLPAMLTDTGVASQMGDPLATMRGVIHLSTAPKGLLHNFTHDIRIGAMAFNEDGAKSECSDLSNDHITYPCDGADNKDGAYLVYPIGIDADGLTTHTDALVSSVNDIKAYAWTPVAEAIYSAIGYYTQQSSLRLNLTDFPIDENAAPCTAWCQNNNILLITDGSSTADLNSEVAAFASMTSPDDGDTDSADGCGALAGSTFFDDLTQYAQNGTNIFNENHGIVEEYYQNLKTYIVISGSPRNEGAGECSPATLLANAAANGGTGAPYYSNNPDELKTNLKEVLNLIRAGASAGSAASVISATRGGDGAIYQAIFFPKVDGPAVPEGDPLKPEVQWIGEVHALHIDEYGVLHEDTNGDGALDNVNDASVVFFFDEATNKTKACYGSVSYGTCSGTVKDLEEVNYLWSAAEWLGQISDTDILLNRNTYISDENKRYIYTWNDLDNDGEVDQAAEWLPFTTRDWAGLSVSGNRAPATIDFGVGTSDEVNEIVSWMRGKDDLSDATLRSREVPTPQNFSLPGSPTSMTWRLGDVIGSTPTAVGRPSEGLHLIYRDATYAAFVNQYRHRRHVIYFGGNDGMLHAVNGGFYDDENMKFWRSATVNNDGGVSYGTSGPALGAELWAYVPYNLLPQLKCLKEPDYNHIFFVDMKPRIFDVQIFSSDSTHPHGWGTILVCGMGLGGGETYPAMADLDGDGSVDYPDDPRQFVSSYVVFDITDPENPPVLLGELTRDPSTDVNLAFATTVPSVVPMKSGNTTDWYLVLGSGPTNREGSSTQNAKLGIFKLDDLVDGSALRIPSALPTSVSAGSYDIATSANGFVSDPITVDYDLVENYRADVVYFGTVEGAFGSSWGGKLYRLVTNADSFSTGPSQWTAPDIMLDAGRPIVSAPTVGTDGEFFWVYVGTGRFFDGKDKTDAGSNAVQVYYGLKEPMDADGNFTWAQIDNFSVTNDTYASSTPGSRGLLRVDQIQVREAFFPEQAVLSCTSGSCLPTMTTDAGSGTLENFGQLVDFMKGVDGWYRLLTDDRERNLGQATLLGGALTFTTYQPFDDECKPEGLSFLYGLYYQTGTGWYEPIFGTDLGTTDDVPPNVVEKLAIGRGLSKTPNLHVGRAEGAKVFVQTSTGTILEIEQPILPVKQYKTGRTSWRN